MLIRTQQTWKSHFITTAKEVMFSPSFVCLSVCLFSSLTWIIIVVREYIIKGYVLHGKNKKNGIFMKISPKMYFWTNLKNIIKFWKSSAFKSGSGNSWKILQYCKMRHFSQFCSRPKTDKIFMNVLPDMYFWTILIRFGENCEFA